MKQRIYCFCLAVCSVTWILPLPWASSAVWINPFGGNFENPANWQGGMVPMVGQNAEFGVLASYEVIFSLDEFSDNLFVTGGNVTFAMEMGSAYSLTNNVLVDDSSLIVNGGLLNVFNSVEVRSGGTLGGNTTVINASTIEVNADGQLGGTLTINGTVMNEGLLAPGNPSDLGGMTINADYIQEFDASLEIAVGGVIPLAQHDQLQVNGTAILAGRLSVPFVNGFVPQMNDTVSFLILGGPGTTEGQFDSLSVPGLPGGLAARINYGATDVSVSFVSPITKGFNSGNLLMGGNDWNDPTLWAGGTVPDGASVVNVLNQQGYDARIELTATGSAGFSHRTTLAGLTNTMTLAVLENADFTAMERLNVNNLGVLELDGGTVHSGLVKVNPGGQIIGNGVVDGDLQLGTTSGSNPAVLSPGFSSGEIRIEDNLTIAQNGSVEIEIFAENDFDKVIVGQDANLGGTLEVVIPETVDPAGLIGVSLAFMTAGDVNFEFADVDLGDNEAGYFIDVDYDSIAVAMSVGLDGDMNFNEGYDEQDIELFAMGLTNEPAYIQAVLEYPIGPGDMNGDNFFDFDDIELFSQLPFPGGITSEQVLEYLLTYASPIPEPSTSLLLVIGYGLFLGPSRQSRHGGKAISFMG